MKKYILLFTLCFSISIFSYGQYSIEDKNGNPAISVSDTASCYDYIDLKLYIKNTSSSTLDSMRMRFVSLNMPSSIVWNYGDDSPTMPGNDDWTVQLCEGVGNTGNCFDLSLLGTGFDLGLGNMAAGESNELKTQFVCYGIEGCGTLKIYVYHLSDTSGGDTLSFTYCCQDMSSVNEIKNTEFELFPNITSDKFNITLKRSLDNGEVIVSNLLGQTIERVSIDGYKRLSLNASAWQEGCYFVLLTENGKAIENKRLYVKK